MPGILSYVIEVILNFESIIDLFNNFDLMIFELIIKFDRMESDWKLKECIMLIKDIYERI